MSNEFTFFRPEAVGNAVHAFAERLEQVLASLERPDLLAPDHDEYRVRLLQDCTLGVEVDLHVAPGAQLRVVVPFTAEADDVVPHMEELHGRLADVLADFDGALTLCAEIERDARTRMQRLARSGISGRVLDVRLSPIDLTATYGMGPVEVLVEGEACNMLRPFRDMWHVDSLADLAERFEGFREAQRRWLPLRKQAQALGAVGFVDPLALALLERLPQGRRSALRVIARTLQEMWYVERGAGPRDAIGLTWYDGVVYGVGDLGDDVKLYARDLIVRGTTINETSVGRSISDFVQHPVLDGLRIAEVEFAREAFAEVRLDSRPVPFNADGEVLAPD